MSEFTGFRFPSEVIVLAVRWYLRYALSYRDVEEVHLAGIQFDEEQDVQPAQQDGVDGEEVAGQDPVGLGVQKLPPGGAGASRCGIDPGGAQDRPDGARPDLIAEPDEFAVDAAVAPAGVLIGEAEDQRADLR